MSLNVYAESNPGVFRNKAGALMLDNSLVLFKKICWYKNKRIYKALKTHGYVIIGIQDLMLKRFKKIWSHRIQ